jgi:hypothetical protein
MSNEKGFNKINVVIESQPGATCRLRLHAFEEILRMEISYHGHDEMNEGVLFDAMAVWESFFVFNDVVTSGCDGEGPSRLEENSREVELKGAVLMAPYLEVAPTDFVINYMHLVACHMGDFVRQWGGLMKGCTTKGA